MNAARRTGLIVAGLCGAAFVILAAWLIPWSWLPGGHVEPVPAGQVFTAAEIARAEQYAGLQRQLAWAGLAGSTGLALLLGLTRLGARAVGRIPGQWWLQVSIGTLGCLSAAELLTMPFAVWARSRAVDYGLTNQAFASWLGDQAVALLVNAVIVAIAMLLIVFSARRAPRTWPIWTTLAGAVLAAAGSFAYPVVVEPLFNDFDSLPAGPLRTQILELADREDVEISDVLVADASRRTTTLNAYVSGLGSTRRIVVYDTLYDEGSTEVTLSVLAHELAHTKNHDIAVGTGLSALGVGVGAGLLAVVLSSRRLRERAGISGPGDPRAVALLLALFAIGAVAVSPVESTMSRAVEARADRDALAVTGDYASFEQLQKDLALRSVADPTPPRWSHFWFGSHPTALQRIDLARKLQARSIE